MFFHDENLSRDRKSQNFQPERRNRETEQLFPFSHYRERSETGQSLVISALESSELTWDTAEVRSSNAWQMYVSIGVWGSNLLTSLNNLEYFIIV